MAGKEKGTAAKLFSETGNEKAVYFHYTSQELNLSLSKASKIYIYNLYILSTHQNANENWNNVLQCEAHWVERHTAFIDLRQLYESILHCLESISLTDDLNNGLDPIQ